MSFVKPPPRTTWPATALSTERRHGPGALEPSSQGLAPSTERRRGAGVLRLPSPAAWPIAAFLVGYPIWWALGFGGLSIIVVAFPMAAVLWRRRPIVVPKGMGLWALLIAGYLVSALTLADTPPGTYGELDTGRVLAYAMRLALYLALLVMVLYLGNLTERELPQLALVRMLGVLFVTTVAGGLLGVFAPAFEFTSPMETLLPEWISGNSFVRNLIHPTAAQVQHVLGHASPRPEAPFEWANAWGSNVSVLLIWFVVGWWAHGGPVRKLCCALLVSLSAIPIVYSLNRGLWIALALTTAYFLLRPHPKPPTTPTLHPTQDIDPAVHTRAHPHSPPGVSPSAHPRPHPTPGIDPSVHPRPHPTPGIDPSRHTRPQPTPHVGPPDLLASHHFHPSPGSVIAPGRSRRALVVGAAVAVGVVVFFAGPLGGIVTQRLDSPHSNRIRAFTVTATIEAATHSPFIGYGNTRNAFGNYKTITTGRTGWCPECGHPPLGSDGQIWLLLITQGFTGALLYIAFFAGAVRRFWHDRTPIGQAGTLVMILVLLYMFVYDGLVTALSLYLISFALLWRNTHLGTP
ncbi:hypothetical protein [Sphaerisporangium corydalis]|uniref:O-antigen ligase domain-containing protein n=1 Tax=Sphaerisporangium corydalis TaxID=1441875 RepID=A0ABV9EEA2_9ACTN|nr:hypothetical protein [Sphaerisporangium corydalis]